MLIRHEFVTTTNHKKVDYFNNSDAQADGYI